MPIVPLSKLVPDRVTAALGLGDSPAPTDRVTLTSEIIAGLAARGAQLGTAALRLLGETRAGNLAGMPSLVLPSKTSFAPFAPVPARTGFRATGMIPVASGTNFNPGTSGQWLTYGSQFARTKHIATASFSSLRLVYWNGLMTDTSAPIELANANAVIMHAAVEVGSKIVAPYRLTASSAAWSSATAYVVGDQVVSGGVDWVAIQASTNQTPAAGSVYWKAVDMYPVHFQGESSTRDVTIQGGQFAVSDPITLSTPLAPGDIFYVRTYAAPNNGTANTGNFPRTVYGYAASGFYTKHSSSGAALAADNTLVGPTAAGDADNTAVFAPVAIIGIPKDGSRPVVFVAGDSLMFGTGETTAIKGDEFPGYALRILADDPVNPTTFKYNFTRAAKGSSVGALQAGPGFAQRLTLAAACTHVVDEWIVNDLGASTTLAAIQAAAQARWQAYAALGLRVIAVTSTPKTTSTDSWATVANQAPATNFGAASKWSQYNAWLLTFPDPSLFAVIDAAAAVVDASGLLWRANAAGNGVLTADGTHPTSEGHAAIASTAPVYLAATPTKPATITAAALFGAP